MEFYFLDSRFRRNDTLHLASAQPVEGAHVSFLRKQESRKKQPDCHFRENDIQGGFPGIAALRPHRKADQTSALPDFPTH